MSKNTLPQETSTGVVEDLNESKQIISPPSHEERKMVMQYFKAMSLRNYESIETCQGLVVWQHEEG